MPSCSHCKGAFIITEDDMKFYCTMGVPAPTWCPECRLMRKMAWSNEGFLYHNQCDNCNKKLISFLPSTDTKKVLCMPCYISDNNNPLRHGIQYDPKKNIFAQMFEMGQKVRYKHLAVAASSENSEYAHQAGQCKNCYMVFHTNDAEDCYYSYAVKKSKDCVDNYRCHDSENCYECIDISRCHSLAYCQDCDDCSEMQFCRNCTGCRNCFLCVGLKNKNFHILNQEYSPDEYKKRIEEYDSGSSTMKTTVQKKLQELIPNHYFKNLQQLFVENCTGDHMFQCQNTFESFDVSNLQDCKFFYQSLFDAKNCYDIYQFGGNQNFCYEGAMTGLNSSNCISVFSGTKNIRVEYCLYSSSCTDCFACIGLKKNQYCILNTQYSKEEYFKLRDQIIDNMKKCGEWGEFFPIEYSISAYNETIAQQWYPLTREEALAKGWKWQENLPGTYGEETITSLPDNIRDATPEIAMGVCKCENCNKNYKIIEQELSFLYKNGFPLPRECFNCRRNKRFQMRNKRIMRDITCCKCNKIVPTTFPEHFKGKICCEECYKKVIY